MSVGVGSNGAEQDKAINAGLFGSGERSLPGLASIKRIQGVIAHHYRINLHLLPYLALHH